MSGGVLGNDGEAKVVLGYGEQSLLADLSYLRVC
jgi:hypothetical protein